MLSDVTVADVYRALDHPNVFAFGPAEDNASCPVEAVVNAHLLNAQDFAESALLENMGATRLAELAQKIQAKS